jgi:hypothetical protein
MWMVEVTEMIYPTCAFRNYEEVEGGMRGGTL